MTDHSHDSGHGHGAHAHGGVHDLKKYGAIFVALCILSAMSFWTYSDFWPSALDTAAVKRMFMMAVSCTKAMLVILFFMHLKYEASWKYVLTIPASFMSLFLVLALIPDIGSRVNGFRFELLKMERAGGRFAIERRQRMATDEDARLLSEASANLAKEHAPHEESHEAKPKRGKKSKKSKAKEAATSSE